MTIFLNTVKVKRQVVFSRQINGTVTLMDTARRILSPTSVLFQQKLLMETGIVPMICFMMTEVKMNKFPKMSS